MPQPSRPHLQVETIGDVTVARFLDRSLCGPLVEAVGEELDRLAERPRLRLSFAQVKEVSGAMLGKLVALHLKVRAAGGSLVLKDLTPWVYEVFEITRLTAVFHVRSRPAERPAPRAARQPALPSGEQLTVSAN